jgi:phage terminase large subunit-like protein
MSEHLPYINLDEIGAEICSRPEGLAFFCKEFWSIICDDPLVWTPHMQVMCDEIEEADRRVFVRQPKEYDVIINVPPGTSKTKIVSVLSTCWEFAMKPSIKVFVGSYSDMAITGIALAIRKVMKSEKYRRWFPEVVISREKDTSHNFLTEANGEFYAFTVGGTLTSKHADILKVDDPIDPAGAKSDAERNKANAFFSETLPSRKTNKEVTITYLIMQRLHEADPTGALLEKKGDRIRHIKLPGIAVDMVPGCVKPAKYRSIYTYIDVPETHPLAKRYKTTRLGVLDPKRNGLGVIEEATIDLGTYGYSGQWDQDPSPANGTIWQREWFIIVPDEDMPKRELGEALGSDWDLAYTKKKKNAASAYITSFKYNNRIFLDDLGWAWKEFPDLIKWMKTKQPSHFIEAKAAGISAKQTLSDQGVIAIEVPVKGGEDKVARARMGSPTAEAGQVCVRKSIADQLFDDPNQGILKFPNGKFADLADCLAQCLQRHSTKGFKYHSESDPEDLEEEDLLAQLEY